MDSEPSSADRKHQPAANDAGARPFVLQYTPLASGVVTAVLGEGGSSIVYEIWVEKLGIKRAVKVLKPGKQIEHAGLFENEMKLTAQLRHPNIVEIHTVGSWNNLPYIEMEHIDGPSLAALIKHGGALPLELCTAIGILACRVLSFAHNHEYTISNRKYKGILHHDLKPENIMFTGKGQLKLMDFGIATPNVNVSEILPGKIVGSLSYLSPEQLTGKRTDPRSDLFALGCILYEMLTGQKVFGEGTLTKLIEQRNRNHIEPIERIVRRAVPKRLARLVYRCLEHDPDDRYESAAEVVAELEKIHAQITRLSPQRVAGMFLADEPLQKIYRFRRRRLPAVLTASAAIALLAGAGFVTWHVQLFAPLRQTPAGSREAADAAVASSVISQPAAVSPQSTSSADSEPGGTRSEQSRPAVVAAQPIARKPAAATRRSSTAAKRSQPKSVARRSEPVAVRSAAISVNPRDSILQASGAADLVAALQVYLTNKKYREVLRVYDLLTASEAAQPRAILLKARALDALQRDRELDDFCRGVNLDDAELDLIRARSLYRRASYDAALALLRRCQSAPAQSGDKANLNRQALYYTALCHTGQYDVQNNEELRQLALNAWFDVKYLYRGDQKAAEYTTANSNIRRLSAPGL